MTERGTRGRLGMGAAALGLGVLALLAPLTASDATEGEVGLLLVLAGGIEIVHGFRRADPGAQRAAWISAAVTILMGTLLINAPFLAGRALVVLLAVWFAFDGLRHLVRVIRPPGATGGTTGQRLLPALGNLGVAGLIIVLRAQAVAWTVAIAGALRIAGTAWSIVQASALTPADSADTVTRDLNLPEHPEVAALGDRLQAEERGRAPIDRGWVGAFLAVLFAIHTGRMEADRSIVGLLSPAVALLGDVVMALAVAYGVVVPARLAARRLTRGLERRAWQWWLVAPAAGAGTPWGRRLVHAWLRHRLRFAVRLRQARYSVPAALGRGLRMGLPAAAVLAATVPIWGVSWYFDTENWAAGIWNSWAAARTDVWREAMVRAVTAAETSAGRPAPSFAVSPPGIVPGGDFAFVVIGDPGEGDASQHVLRDQLLQVSGHDDVKFVVVSSDVVYPTGAMKDYEPKFWLPFKGCVKPVYAIPGNHDWYDALEAFAATFLEAGAARVTMRARVEADHRLTSTTDRHIEALVAEAARLRDEYRVPTGFQQAPFFQLRTERFTLIAVDTGVLKRVDPAQLEWLRSALEAARGTFIMAVLGHPFLAGGHDLGADHEDFASIRRLLREHGVTIVMAGDTHDFEYYAEPGSPGSRMTHHFVNGGGGAYLSLGAALAWPKRAVTAEWAFHPSRAPIVAKIDALTPFWKRPLWWWTKRADAWPFSAEWLSAAFDYNAAPFFQSFVEVRVEPSAGRVRVLPYGVHGRLRWADLASSAGLRPRGAAAEDFAEWAVDMAPVPNRPGESAR